MKDSQRKAMYAKRVDWDDVGKRLDKAPWEGKCVKCHKKSKNIMYYNMCPPCFRVEELKRSGFKKGEIK